MLELINSASYWAVPFLAAVLLVLVVGCLVALVMRLLGRRTALENAARRQDDITNTTIMFQTMRDILEQQKDVARQLNVSLDKKVTYIRSIVETAVADLHEMRETARQLATELTATKAEFAALQTQLGRPDTTSKAPDTAQGDSAHAQAVEEQHELDALTRPALEEPPDSGLDYWVGLDSGEVPEEEEPEPVATPPETPENAEAARDAFRALLNLDSSGSDAKSRKSGSEHDGGNGRSSGAPLKKRIYEYSDGGMSVSEIARELGLGKGEVRLILNLRKDRGE